MNKTITITTTADWAELIITDSAIWLIGEPHKVSVRSDGDNASINTVVVDGKKLYIRQETFHNRAITVQIQVSTNSNSETLELRASHRGENGRTSVKAEGATGRAKQINSLKASRYTIKL